MGRELVANIGKLAACTVLAATACSRRPGGEVTLLNVSYDPTREMYADINAAFARRWQASGNGRIVVKQSHGGSGKQARAVMDGLEADVVTLALAYDVDVLSRNGLIRAGWQERLPHGSAPYASTIVFVVRKGNPRRIKDWEDLARPGLAVITANPKTSGGARWNYLGAWGHALRRARGGEAKARELAAGIFRNVPVLDGGARASTTTFAERGIGDVLIAWENEALLLAKEIGQDRFQIVTPSDTILAEPPVALVDQYVEKHGTRAAAQAYLEYLYSDEGQEIVARHHFRPRSDAVAARFQGKFPKVETFTVGELFGGWSKAQKRHFDDGGEFDRLYKGPR